MEFNHFLSAYYPDTSYGGDRLYGDMVEQAVVAEQCGYRGVSIPEHHLVNVLLVPDPLQLAVKVAAVTQDVEIVTSISVLPIHDMRIFAGAAIQADILCGRRLKIGVGRGAFAYELARLGHPIEHSKEKFDESLDVLLALFEKEEVSWQGKYYNFEPLTVMPRPVNGKAPPLMVAAVTPPAIYASVKRGFHIQTAALDGSHDSLKAQVDAFRSGREELGDAGKHLKLALSRVCIVVENEASVKRVRQLAYEYYGRFNNVFTGPGVVKNGKIELLPQKHTIEELSRNLVICTADEMVDQLEAYAGLGIDDLICNANVGISNVEVIESMQRFASDVLPKLSFGSKSTGPQTRHTAQNTLRGISA